MSLRQKIAPYSPFAKVLLASAGTLLVAYGVYDQATLKAMIGSLTAIAVAGWEFYDRFIVKDTTDE